MKLFCLDYNCFIYTEYIYIYIYYIYISVYTVENGEG